MDQPLTGWIHSFESGGMVDGPGLRFIVFLQGCPLRCLYCHNPDSWKFRRGLELGSDAVIDEAKKYKVWMDTSGGGITLSGGEPLAQPEFTLDIIRRAHAEGIHVALDTSGFGKLDTIRDCLDEADLVLMDVKTANSAKHLSLAGVKADEPLAALDYLRKTGKPLWLRHVLVPGLTDDQDDLQELRRLLSGLPNLERFEILPFHKMGEEKWSQEGLDYTLADTAAPSAEQMDELKAYFKDAGIPVGD